MTALRQDRAQLEPTAGLPMGNPGHDTTAVERRSHRARRCDTGGDSWCGVGLPGFEPGTSTSRTWRANQAALQPATPAVRRPRKEPRTADEPSDATAKPVAPTPVHPGRCGSGNRRPHGRRRRCAVEWRRRASSPSAQFSVPALPGEAVSAAWITTLATRRLSISATRSSQPSKGIRSPSSGMWPKASKR